MIESKQSLKGKTNVHLPVKMLQNRMLHRGLYVSV